MFVIQRTRGQLKEHITVLRHHIIVWQSHPYLHIYIHIYSIKELLNYLKIMYMGKYASPDSV